MKKLYISALACGIILTANAQNSDTTDLQEVVVTTTRAQNEFKKAARKVTIITKEDIEKEIDQSTYIIFPSRLENFSVALLEAMSRGRICFGWDIPSFNEIIQHEANGFIVDDYEQISNYIAELEGDN